MPVLLNTHILIPILGFGLFKSIGTVANSTGGLIISYFILFDCKFHLKSKLFLRCLKSISLFIIFKLNYLKYVQLK